MPAQEAEATTHYEKLTSRDVLTGLSDRFTILYHSTISEYYTIVQPPSVSIDVPVVNDDARDAKNIVGPMISWACAKRP